ncbi:MAG: ABC transporter ATP-binding protein [Candidatus Lokiarchaeota archaeon]|nr:ABC transporter ATP-binding protein [Candidatus Lokiarchaeota archaeon]
MGKIIEVKNITKKFGGLTAVNDVSFEIQRGEMVGLIGPNGAGKTTLFSMISCFEKPSSGSIYYDGINITSKKPYKVVNLGLTRTFQLVRSFKYLSLLDNVSVSCLSKRGKKAAKEVGVQEQASLILTDVGLIDKARIPPIILPHGDLRKLEIGKALGSNPEVLLLDEPFSGLSQEEKDSLKELIVRLNNDGVTVFMTGHVLRELMTLVPRVIAMHRGKLIAEGHPADVANHKFVREAYLGKGETFIEEKKN